LQEFLKKCTAFQELIFAQIVWVSAGAEAILLDPSTLFLDHLPPPSICSLAWSATTTPILSLTPSGLLLNPVPLTVTGTKRATAQAQHQLPQTERSPGTEAVDIRRGADGAWHGPSSTQATLPVEQDGLEGRRR
jgi:hypothetical protein